MMITDQSYKGNESTQSGKRTQIHFCRNQGRGNSEFKILGMRRVNLFEEKNQNRVSKWKAALYDKHVSAETLRFP
jgi:hypothetical protein